MATGGSAIEFSSFRALSCGFHFTSRFAVLPSVPNLGPQALTNSATLIPILSSCYGASCGVGAVGSGVTSAVPPSTLLRGWSSSSSSSSSPPPEYKGFKDYKLPPVNPPDAENPDPATLREQWHNATRLYSRWYSHAWGTAILAGVTLFGIGWWIKGENPLNPLSPTGSTKKEESAD